MQSLNTNFFNSWPLKFWGGTIIPLQCFKSWHNAFSTLHCLLSHKVLLGKCNLILISFTRPPLFHVYAGFGTGTFFCCVTVVLLRGLLLTEATGIRDGLVSLSSVIVRWNILQSIIRDVSPFWNIGLGFLFMVWKDAPWNMQENKKKIHPKILSRTYFIAISVQQIKTYLSSIDSIILHWLLMAPKSQSNLGVITGFGQYNSLNNGPILIKLVSMDS